MHAGKIVALVVVLGVLGFLAWKRGKSTDDPLAAAGQVEVAPGLDPARVAAIRLENVANRETVRFERDEQGQWWIVDPVHWRADDGMIRELLDFARRGRAHIAPGIRPEDAGLRPPRLEIELVERRVGSDERRHRITFGAMDVNPNLAFAMVGPADDRVVVRASRAPIGAIDHRPEFFRDRRLLHLDWRDVTSFTRRVDPAVWARGDGGAESDQEEPIELVAEPQEDSWWAVSPFAVRLDPHGLGAIVRNVAQLRVRAFLEDSPVSLERWGVDTAPIDVTLEVRGEERVTIHIGHGPHEADVPFDARRWAARIEGRPNVVALDEVAVRLLLTPLVYLIDHQIARFDRDAAQGATIELDGRRIELRRKHSAWFVFADGDWRLASDAAVADLLNALTRIELAGYPWLGEPDGAPAGAEIQGRIEVRIAGREPGTERVVGGELAAPSSVRGVRGRPLRRFGESAFGLLAEDSVGALLPAVETLLATRILRLPELDQSEVEVMGEGTTRRWTRDRLRGHWLAAGTTVEDRRFALIVDGLFTLRAQRWLTEEERARAENEGTEQQIAVVVRDAAGASKRYTLGRLPGTEEVVAAVDGQWAVVGPGTHRQLLDLLSRD